MIKLQHNLPRTLTLACSGGVDSMAAADFLKRNHTVKLLFVDHGTEASFQASFFLEKYAKRNDLELDIRHICTQVPTGVSQEEHWRNERYRIFHSLVETVVTCHHLNDCVETWVWSSMHGQGKIIPYRNGNVIRPFRLTEKSQFVDWCKRHDVDWIEDRTNTDTKYMRNYIRHEVMPKILKINPGINKVVAKKVRQEDK